MILTMDCRLIMQLAHTLSRRESRAEVELHTLHLGTEKVQGESIVQFKVRVIQTMSRDILVDADSEKDAANQVAKLNADQLEEEQVKQYEQQVVFVSLAPFEDWPY